MTQHYVCYNNKFYNEDQPIFQLNRAMKFGDGVFETIRIESGKTKYLEFHLERLQKGLKALSINCPKGELDLLKVCIEQLLIKNELEGGGVLRILAFRSGLDKYTPHSDNVIFYIETEIIKQNSYVLNRKGLSLGLSKKVTFQSNPLSNLKTLNALPYVLASIEKRDSKFDELVLLNSENQIVEATSSNIFIVLKDKVLTPPLSSGCVEGVMRRVVINKLKTLGLEVELREIDVEVLDVVNEIFITNSITGIQWISSYESKRYFKKISSKLIGTI